MRISTLACLLAVATGLAGLGCSGPERDKAAAPSTATVRAATAELETVPEILVVPGTLEPRTRITIASQLNGFVQDLRVHVGDRVAAGQVLLTLDARDVRAQQDVAQSALAEAQAAQDEARKGTAVAESAREAAGASERLAEATLARYQTLLQTKSVSPQEFDEVRARREAAAAELASRTTLVAAAGDRLRQVEARIRQAKAQSQRAQVVADWSTVKAPISGIIANRQVDSGHSVFPGTPLLTIEETGVMQVVASLPANQAHRIRRGLIVRLRSDASSTEVLTGSVSEISPVSEPGAHTVQFKLDLSSHPELPSGSFLRVEIPAGERQTLLIPRASIRESGQLTAIFCVEAGSIARLRLVKVSPFDAEKLEVQAGLERGEKYLLNPSEQIIDGTRVEIRP